MWNRVSLTYLIGCSCIASLLSVPPADREGWRQLVVLIASLTLPFFLLLMRRRAGFWKGALQLLFILAATLISGFPSSFFWYAHLEYVRLGSEINLLEALGWTLGESLAFFLYFDVLPAAIIAGICYPIGYLVCFQLFRLAKGYSEPE